MNGYVSTYFPEDVECNNNDCGADGKNAKQEGERGHDGKGDEGEVNLGEREEDRMPGYAG